MSEIFKQIIDWLEVWALFIPLIILLLKSKQPGILAPVVIYVFIGLYFNYLSDVSWKGKKLYNFPHWFQSNTYLYNLHSVARLILFSWFFNKLDQPFKTIKKLVITFSLIFLAVNFLWFEDFFKFNLISSRLHAAEAGVLLFYCLQYYFYVLTQEQTSVNRSSSFWIVTGLSIFIIISFPIYLFYDAIIHQSINFGYNIWIVQKVAFLLFCICMAKAFYQSKP
jgi:hypothetical protein